jgi:hypothetical protein
LVFKLMFGQRKVIAKNRTAALFVAKLCLLKNQSPVIE